eukprot:GHVQ01024358.1.p1 GENE.GHVQ01024358.1~~GHVQ01024358.1.p1  ORF type:complete len:400 (-),score=14.32 GHVQ01024358.1:289-1488(-)
MLFGRYIKRRGLEELKNYEYSSAGYTVTDRLLNYWWEAAVKLVPIWVAPNVLTLIGFFCAIFSFILLLRYSPTLTESGPSWIYVVIALLMFLYQTFDAIDGKQARRTGTSSPLGQLFDHGCDVMMVTAASFTTIGVTLSGAGMKQYAAVVISTQVHQFIYMWWEYHFRVFYAATGPVGVTEAQIGMIICSMISWIFGPEVYGIDCLRLVPEPQRELIASFFSGSLSLRDLMIAWLITMNTIVAVFDIVLGIYKAERKLLASAQLGSLGIFVCVQWFFYRACLLTDRPVSSEAVYFIMSSTYSILVLRLCLSSTCKIPFGPVQWPVFPFFIAVGLLHCDLLMSKSFLVSLSNRTLVISALCAWNFIYLLDLLVTSVIDICSYLRISCFVIPHQKAIEKQS